MCHWQARPKAGCRAKPGHFGPGLARPWVTAQQGLWPGLEQSKAEAPAQAAALLRCDMLLCIMSQCAFFLLFIILNLR